MNGESNYRNPAWALTSNLRERRQYCRVIDTFWYIELIDPLVEIIYWLKTNEKRTCTSKIILDYSTALIVLYNLERPAKNPKHLQMQRNSECHRRRGEVENIVADYEIKVAKGNQKQFKTVYIAQLQKIAVDIFLSCNNLFQEKSKTIFSELSL